MKRTSLVSSLAVLCGALISAAALAAAPAVPGAGPGGPPGVQSSGATQKPMVSCSRIGLQYAAQQYLAGQAKGDYSAMPLPTAGVGYWEQMKPADIKTGFLTKKLSINRSFALFDQDTCQAYVEIIVADNAEPYVAGIRLRVNYDKIAEIEVIYETTDYWGFNAADYLKYASLEDWGPVDAAKRATRGQLVNAANAYLDAFLEAKIEAVPWGYPCVRIEGGNMYTGNKDGPTRPDASCSAGVPSGVNIANRRFIVDEIQNTVVVLCTFGAGGPTSSGAPDQHMFRLENGKLRYVHTLTALMQNRALPAGGAPRAGGPPSAPGAAPAPAAPK